MSPRVRKSCMAATVLVVVFFLQACAAPKADNRDPVRYSVAGTAVTIVSAQTPYDADVRARDAFLHWFKRGFETVLSGKAPMMISWEDSLRGRAGRDGYDLGMEEAEKYLKNRK